MICTIAHQNLSQWKRKVVYRSRDRVRYKDEQVVQREHLDAQSCNQLLRSARLWLAFTTTHSTERKTLLIFYKYNIFSIKCRHFRRNNVFLLILRVFISFTKQFFTFHSNRVKCKNQIFALDGIRTHDLLHSRQDICFVFYILLY